MPLYEYRCSACGERFERIQRFSDPPVEVCPACGERKVEKLLSSPAIQFKGSGWYITDYARKGAVAPADGATPAETKDAKDTKDAKPSTDGSSSSDSSSSTTSGTAPSPKPAS